MEAVVFTGIQASGKTSFYVERFLRTHVRISLDVLRTRHRELRFLETCLETGQRLVVDNTNPTAAERARYVAPAREAGFAVVAYLFETAPAEALRRNDPRLVGDRVPERGILGTFKRLEPPSLDEGFDAIWRVVAVHGIFDVEQLAPL